MSPTVHQSIQVVTWSGIGTLGKKVDKWLFYNKILVVIHAEVAELADALRSGRSGQYAREGSNPSFGTNPAMSGIFYLTNPFTLSSRIFCCNIGV